jgi:hypothetical protein
MTQWSSPSREKIAILPMQLELLPRLPSQPVRLLLLKTRIMLSTTHSITKEEVVDKKDKDSSRYQVKIAQLNSQPRPETPIQVAWYPQELLDRWLRAAKEADSVLFKPLEDHRATMLRCKMLT